MSVFENLTFVESIFEMIDVNKWLKFKATTEEQQKEAQRREENSNSILKKLYIPIPLENV